MYHDRKSAICNVAFAVTLGLAAALAPARPAGADPGECYAGAKAAADDIFRSTAYQPVANAARYRLNNESQYRLADSAAFRLVDDAQYRLNGAAPRCRPSAVTAFGLPTPGTGALRA